MYANVSNRSVNSFTVTWACSTETTGVVGYGINEISSYQFGIVKSKIHTQTVPNLASNQAYNFSVSCGQKATATSPITQVKTLQLRSPLNFPVNISFPNIAFPEIQLDPFFQLPVTFELPQIPPFTMPPIEPTISLVEKFQRGIWVLGGVGALGNPVAQVDLFDPNDGSWMAAISNIPTPRINAGIVSNSGKIYVIGGLIGVNAQSLVEEYDPITNIWRTMANMPVTLQSFSVSSVGSDIYLIGGTTSNAMLTGTLPPFNVYRFSPFIGPNGSWATIISSTALVGRVDMAACAIDGQFFFTGGRYYLDGSAYATTDAYLTAGNTTSTANESPLTAARHGIATVCYRPIPTDPFPTDTKAILMVGGSTGTNLNTPITNIVPSTVFNYYTPLTNSMYSSPIFPISIYKASAEIAYQYRRLYIMGGSTIINIPLDTIYTLDLASPTAGPWTLSPITMPVPRFGHASVILSR